METVGKRVKLLTNDVCKALWEESGQRPAVSTVTGSVSLR